MKQTQSSDAINFISRHFRPDAFSSRRAWKKISASFATPFWRTRWVAAATIFVVLSAAATIFVLNNPSTPVAAPQTAVAPAPATPQSFDFSFSALPLLQAVDSIEKKCSVKIENLPPENPEISLNFKGTPAELIELINQSLDTELRISE